MAIEGTKGFEKNPKSNSSMTFTVVSAEKTPQLSSRFEEVVYSHKVIELGLEVVESHLEWLARERNLLLQRRTCLVQKIQQMHMLTSSVGKLPFATITQFLPLTDFCSLRTTSQHFKAMCETENQLLLAHIGSPKASLSTDDACAFVARLCLPMVQSLVIDAKRFSGKAILKALVPHASALRSLTSLRVSAAAETGEFLADLFAFMEGLPACQLTSVHFSGLRSIAHVGTLVERQALSIERFKVDYFVNGHEKDIAAQYLPVMPRLRAFTYDVADLTDLPIDLISATLSAVERKELVESIYMPHMQISGDTTRVLRFVSLLKQFSSCKQLVVRFRHLPLSIGDIVGLREAFASLPAVCISDHFVVCQSTWCTWWPSLTEVWREANEITGISVFREQIDFESLGTSAQQEWVKLSEDQRRLWTDRIAPNIYDLYLQQSVSPS